MRPGAGASLGAIDAIGQDSARAVCACADAAAASVLMRHIRSEKAARVVPLVCLVQHCGVVRRRAQLGIHQTRQSQPAVVSPRRRRCATRDRRRLERQEEPPRAQESVNDLLSVEGVPAPPVSQP